MKEWESRAIDRPRARKQDGEVGPQALDSVSDLSTQYPAVARLRMGGGLAQRKCMNQEYTAACTVHGASTTLRPPFRHVGFQRAVA